MEPLEDLNKVEASVFTDDFGDEYIWSHDSDGKLIKVYLIKD